MASTVLICGGCGREFVASRSHARWCSEACRKATTRAAARDHWPEILERGEHVAVEKVRAGEFDYIDALVSLTGKELRSLPEWRAV